ncbi:gluconokinase [Mycetocola zhujimingii]|uniref:gluconokinase n=1 Tax=Mycetocola zhujimingii TaxID=2079792 RepID=UPI000D3CBB97|nr:gluconokinase [Mycetocola zhujimingii]AWB86981.1 transferase [Mycetocola zhujimingii]
MSQQTTAHTQIIVMGVSGSGKSTIGALIAGALGVPFVDGDALHPRSNIEKMAGGHPLEDADRWPWLALVGRTLADADGAGGMVIACSALRRAYREAILESAPHARFVHLDGSRDVLASRLEGRSGHFMPPSLLDSQFATLEPLARDEPGIVVDIDRPVAAIVDDAVARIRAGEGIREGEDARADEGVAGA